MAGLQEDPTCLQIDGINPDIWIPAAVCMAHPIRRDGIALCQQYNLGEQRGQDEQDHERPESISQGLGALHTQHKQTDRNLEQTQDGKEK